MSVERQRFSRVQRLTIFYEEMNQTLTNWSKPVSLNSSETHLNHASFTRWPLIIYYVLLSSGAVLNSVVIYVMLRSGKARRNISSFLICHLSFTHLLFHFVIPMSQLVQLLFLLSSTSCKASVLVSYTSAAAIFSSLAAIAWDRRRNVLRPFQSLSPRKLKTFLFLVTSIWCYAFMTSLPFLYSIKSSSRVICSQENNGTESCRDYSYCTLPADWKDQLTRTFYFVVAFVAPLLYMFFAYGKIAVSLWNRSKNGTIHKAVAKAKMKSTRLMVAAILVFVVCYAPTLVLLLLEVYSILENLSSEYYFIVYFWCIILQTSSSSINPVIYAFLSPDFRRGVLRHCCFCCSSHCPLSRVEPVI